MPIYEYQCEKCSKIFAVRMSMTDHEKERVVCPDCKEIRVAPQYGSFFAKTSKKS
jgi:putative FmdB family regulatory protein